MKSRLFRISKVLLAVIFAFGILLSVLPASEVQAAAKMTNKKAQKILKKKIKNKFCRYAFADIDNDNIDEMFVLGFSGKFVDGDDKKKSLTVYKVEGKKAKAIYEHSVKGDLFHPTLSFQLFTDGDNSYMEVDYLHEGYGYSILYMYGADGYNEIARVDADLASFEIEYRIRGKLYSEEEFFSFLGDMDVEDVYYTLNDCSAKVANKYMKKMLKAEYNYRCKNGVFDKKTASIVYSDEDGDGIDELIVRKDAISGTVLHVSLSDDNSADYFVDSIDYTIENGKIVFDIPEDYLGDEEWGEVDGEQYLGIYQYDRCSIEVAREGEAAFVFDIKWGSSAFQTDQWIYFAFYQGEDNDGNAYFVCSDGGTHVSHITDMETEVTEDEVIATDLAAEFVISDGLLYWHDLNDDSKTVWDFGFEKIS